MRLLISLFMSLLNKEYAKGLTEEFNTTIWILYFNIVTFWMFTEHENKTTANIDPATQKKQRSSRHRNLVLRVKRR